MPSQIRQVLGGISSTCTVQDNTWDLLIAIAVSWMVTLPFAEDKSGESEKENLVE
jgi:hypothetical protein